MRKLVGYKPKSDKLYDAFCRLACVTGMEGPIPKGSEAYRTIIEYGVIHWFKPVYLKPKLKGYDFRNAIVQEFCSKMFEGYDFDEHIQRNGVHIMPHSYMVKALRELGVLDTWCHPINAGE